jgi:hypothetical protein
MNKKGTNNLDVIILVLLLVATIATIILQILFSSPTSTKVETSLFSILQFIFSLAFSWVLARISLRSEFQESQKKFAISAYRRIIEINNAVNRLISRTTSHMGKVENSTDHELDVITEIGIGIRESIRSSISDWADIIGDEIETVNKIQTIREKQSLENLNPAAFETDENQPDENDAVVEKLISTLPKSLKISADEFRSDYMSRIHRGVITLRREEKRKGYIELRGFSESSFDKDICNFKAGDILQVRIGDDNENRIGVLIAYDDEGNSVGVMTNKMGGIAQGYSDAADMLIRYLGKSIFRIEILDIDSSKEKQEDERHYFTAKILEPGREEDVIET